MAHGKCQRLNIDASDIVRQTLLRAHEKREQIRGQNGSGGLFKAGITFFETAVLSIHVRARPRVAFLRRLA